MYSHGYENVCLIPKKGIAKSRSKDCDSRARLGRYRFSTPVMPANMECCIDFTTARIVDSLENFYVMHRFDDTAEFIQSANASNFRVVSISVGVQREDYELITRIYLEALKHNRQWRVDYITIDIAHGHSVMAQDLLKYINTLYVDAKILKPFIIVGNICTADAVYDLKKWGADAVKVGIAQGAACTTYTHTGFGIPMFEAVLNCGSRTCGHRLPIIADGGAKNNGDFVKALVGGANMCMSGGMFAACIDSPAEPVFDVEGNLAFKKYYGSASSRSKSKRGEQKHIEGQEIIVPSNKMTYTELYKEIKGDIQSGISYGGGKDLSCLTDVEYKYRG